MVFEFIIELLKQTIFKIGLKLTLIKRLPQHLLPFHQALKKLYFLLVKNLHRIRIMLHLICLFDKELVVMLQL